MKNSFYNYILNEVEGKNNIKIFNALKGSFVELNEEYINVYNYIKNNIKSKEYDEKIINDLLEAGLICSLS